MIFAGNVRVKRVEAASPGGLSPALRPGSDGSLSISSSARLPVPVPLDRHRLLAGLNTNLLLPAAASSFSWRAKVVQER